MTLCRLLSPRSVCVKFCICNDAGSEVKNIVILQLFVNNEVNNHTTEK
jgi:hypothetical protein